MSTDISQRRVHGMQNEVDGADSYITHDRYLRQLMRIISFNAAHIFIISSSGYYLTLFSINCTSSERSTGIFQIIALKFAVKVINEKH